MKYILLYIYVCVSRTFIFKLLDDSFITSRFQSDKWQIRFKLAQNLKCDEVYLNLRIIKEIIISSL